MKHAYRFGAFSAVAAALAVLVGLFAAQAGGSNADSFAVDLDTAGNTATALGARDECRQVNAGDTVTIDIAATNIPAGAPMVGFHFELGYDQSALSITGKDAAGLLSTATGYTELDFSDPVPDSDGAYVADVADLGATGVSGSGYLQRLTVAVDAGAPAGGYQLSLNGSLHLDLNNIERFSDAEFGARLAVGVTCESLGEPTATPIPDTNLQGDVDCTDVVTSVDSLKILRYVAQLSVSQTEPCDDIGTGGPPAQGDVDCSGTVNSVDALKVLRHVALLTVSQIEPCDDIST